MASVVQKFRKQQLKALTDAVGVYALCDLDGVPIYVGQSTDGIRSRVLRHLTSARSDIIANRQVDVWEIAFVHAYPVADASAITPLEAAVFALFDGQKPLMNGTVPGLTGGPSPAVPEPAQVVCVMPDDEIRVRLDPALRLPRQIEHIGRLVDYILTVKDALHLRRSLSAHFERLDAYRAAFLEPNDSSDEEESDGEADART